MKFFIVDDDQTTVELMSALLEAAGHTVGSSVAGAYALPQINERRPDCVLTDLVMAEVNGLDLCREIRARRNLKNVRIIMVSARPRDLWWEEAAKAGADGYVGKPLDPSTFVGEIAAILEEGAA